MKTIILDNNQYKLLMHYFEQLSDYYSNAGCNDLEKSIRDMWTQEEGQTIADEFAKYNNPKTPNGPPWPIPDSCLLYWMKSKLKEQFEKPETNI